MATQPLTIWTYPKNYRVWKAQIAGKYNQVEIVTPEFAMGTQNKSSEFLAKFPMGKVPAMETPFGALFESGAIARYVARLRADTGLLGTNFFQGSQIDQWIDWCSFELESARGAWLAPMWGYRPYVQSVYEEAKKNVLNCLNVLNNHLKTRTYLVGNQVTMADIVIVTALYSLFSEVIVDKQREAVPEVIRWYNTCINQPQFSEVMDPTVFAKEEKVYVPKGESKAEVKAAPAEDKPAPKSEEGGKKNKNKQSKKNEEKPEETPKAAEESGKKNKGNKQQSKQAEEAPKEAEKAKEETPKKGGKGGNKQESGKKAEERPKTAETKETPKKTEEKPKETPKKEADAKPKQESGKKEGGQQQQGGGQSNKKKSKGKN